jgi:Flp pilus assembly protein TadG
MKKLLKKFYKDECGGPIIEMGFIGIFVIICLPALFDLTLLINNKMKLASGLRGGEQYAVKYPTDTAGIIQSVASASGIPAADLTVTNTQTCTCNSTSIACNTTCVGILEKYNTINAAYDINSQFLYGNIYSGNLNQSIIIRVK